MKLLKSFLTIALVLPLTPLGCPVDYYGVAFDQPFDSYEVITWNEEKVRLLNFSVFLKRNPEMVGYISFCGLTVDDMKNRRARAKLAKGYLKSKLKIPKSRIVLVQGKSCYLTQTILQPMPKGSPAPKFFDEPDSDI